MADIRDLEDFRIDCNHQSSAPEWNLLELLGDRQRPVTERTSVTTTSDRPTLSSPELRSLIQQNTVRVETNGSLGTGPVVRTPDGQKVILTDDHVIGNKPVGSIVTVRFNGQRYRTRVIGKDPANDIAVLALPSALQSLPGIEMAPTGQNQRGQKIITAGFPGGSDSIVITEGRAGRTTRAGNAGVVDASPQQDRNRPLLEADLHARKGMSGGAVLNDKGQLVGLIHAANGDTMFGRRDISGRIREVTRGTHSLITPVDLVQRTLGGSGRDFRPVDVPSARPDQDQFAMPDLRDFFRRQRGQSILEHPAVRELIASLLRGDERELRFNSPFRRGDQYAQNQPRMRIIIRIARA